MPFAELNDLLNLAICYIYLINKAVFGYRPPIVVQEASISVSQKIIH